MPLSDLIYELEFFRLDNSKDHIEFKFIDINYSPGSLISPISPSSPRGYKQGFRKYLEKFSVQWHAEYFQNYPYVKDDENE